MAKDFRADFLCLHRLVPTKFKYFQTIYDKLTLNAPRSSTMQVSTASRPIATVAFWIAPLNFGSVTETIQDKSCFCVD